MMTHNLQKRASACSTASAVPHVNAVVYGAVVVFLAAPFFVFDTIPLYDLPNHMAQQIIRHVDQMALDTELVKRLDTLQQFLNLPR